MMNAKSILDTFARSAGFAGGVRWMYNNALMFIELPENNWLYVRTSLDSFELKHSSIMQDVVQAQSWDDAVEKIAKALDEDSLYVGMTKISKNSGAAAEFMIGCGLLGLGE